MSARKKVPLWLRWVGLLSLSAACATLYARLNGDRIKFPHDRHIKAKVECVACHDTIFDATKLGDLTTLPKEKKCLECHKEKKEKNECGFCHTQPDHPGTFVRESTHLHFNHAKHLEKDENCSVCHVALPEPGQVDRPIPPMARCLSCHNHQQEFDAGKCSACHEDLTRFPLKPITSFNHQGNFTRQHGPLSRTAGAACAQCHDQRFCADCHAATVSTKIENLLIDKVERQFIHWGDYQARHSIEAKGNEPLCQKCHGTSFCDSCHRAQRLSGNSDNPLNPHPSGWGTPGNAQFHGTAARRDIVSCAGCHDQGAQSNCVSCHRVGGMGGNPHPPGFSTRHPMDEVNRNPMCVTCHL